MKLNEYQTKFRFAELGIPIPHGKIAHTSQQAHEIARDFVGPLVVKAQFTGSAQHSDVIHLAQTPEEARQHADAILKTAFNGTAVYEVLIEPAYTPIARMYLGIRLDRSAGKPVIVASADGSAYLRARGQRFQDTGVREYIDLLRGLLDYQVRNLASGINLPREHWRPFGIIAHNLFTCYVRSDALLAEINPLIITADAEMLALDGRMVIDDNAMFRHKDLSAMRYAHPESAAENMALQAGISFVKLNGQIGCMVNGAGLAMTTMDMTALFSNGEIRPANFLDIGGGARSDQVATGLRIILADSDVKVVLVNIFGGLTRCDEVAGGILQACHDVQPELPIIVRLQGTRVDEAHEILEKAGFPRLISATTLTDAAQKAIAAAREA